MDRIPIKDPFFIFYDSRSGSTYLANLLSKNSNVAIPPESNFLHMIFTKYQKGSITNEKDLKTILDIISKDSKFIDWGIDINNNNIINYLSLKLPLSLKEFIVLVCTIYKNKHFSGEKTFGIKKGNYIRHYKKIKELFPESKFIGLIRDGRAVYNSQKNSIYSKTGRPFETNPYRAARQWCIMIEMLNLVKNTYPETMILYYEKLITDQDKTIKLINKFIGASENDKNSTSEIRYSIPDRYGNMHNNIENKPLVSRINAWRNTLTNDEIFAFESVAFKQLLSEGYSLINSTESLKKLHKKIRTRLKIAWK